ncbi:MAG TPA: helix-turn-helix domain-containing protein [Candidatus Tumulicola sp.]
MGRFLRERREALAPESVGISSGRRRRTPGLRREEVAFLADIGVKWYARLEAGDDVHPSAAALAGIAVALRLSAAEHEYLLALAGLGQPTMVGPHKGEMPKPLDLLLGSTSGIAITAGDRILIPLRWNGMAEALYGLSRIKDPVDRNALVRALFDPDFIAYLGQEREELIFGAVGMLRMSYASPTRTQFVAPVYERVKDHPLFQKAWQQRVVTRELPQQQTMVRNHPLVGRIDMFTVDFSSAVGADWIIHVMIPADEATVAKFRRLEELGKAKRPFEEAGAACS